jgi:serine/threonine-protein kinase PpkA
MTTEVPGFTIRHKIADGGMASVYLAVQESLQRDVALKVLAAGNEDNFRQRFLNEGRLLASLSHPSVITIHDIGILANGQGYIAMEYLRGGDLASRLQQPLPPAQALQLLRQLAAALSVVHRAGIVHRDVKPANILFRADDTPVISDFGIARREQQDVKLTMDGYTVGSPAYSSPEQLHGRQVDARSDIYSLGVTFYQMLTGSNPYCAESFADTIVNHLHMEIPPLPAALAQWQPLLNGMLAKNAADRFASCDELIAAIDAMPRITADPLGGAGTQALPAGQQKTLQVSLPEGIAADATAVLPLSAGDAGSAPRNPRRWLLGVAMMVLVFTVIGMTSAAVMRGIKSYQQQQRLQALVQQQLDLAEQRFAASKYLTPANDNAVMYYRRVLELDADNEAARQGLIRVAERYEELARASFAAGRYDRGMALIDKGLAVVPEHAGLLQLKQQQQKQGHPTTRFFRNIFR